MASGGLEARVGLQRHFTPAVGVPNAGTLDGDLLAGEGGHASPAAVARVAAARLPLVAGAAEARDLVLQEAGGDQQAKLQGQVLQGVLHQLQEFVAIQGQLDVTIAGAGLAFMGGMGRVPLVGAGSVRVISLQGGSSFQGILTSPV
jgi:hypothetical protein